MNNSILSVKNLTKTFKSGGFFKKAQSFTAVNDISFDLKEGEILGFLGPNGAGKTTTIQMLLDLLTPTSGQIKYFGNELTSANRAQIMQHISFASSYLKLPGSLTVEENLNLYGKIYSMPKALRLEQIERNINFFGISKIRNKITRTLSAGQLTRLMLAKAFLPKPRIVLLDEPTAALDPEISLQIRRFILEERKKTGISIIFTSHNMAEVEELCDRVIIIKDGKIIASDTPKNLAALVKISHVKFLISENIEKLIEYAKQKNLSHEVDNDFVTINLEEDNIASLLTDVTKLNIKYTQISIDKPNLEDYFLEIAK